MAILGIVYKQPREILDFDVDYSSVLAGRTSALTTATAEVTPASNLVLDSTTVFTVDNKVKVVISGGTDLVSYKVTVLTNTDDGLKYEDEITVIVEED